MEVRAGVSGPARGSSAHGPIGCAADLASPQMETYSICGGDKLTSEAKAGTELSPGPVC